MSWKRNHFPDNKAQTCGIDRTTYGYEILLKLSN